MTPHSEALAASFSRDGSVLYVSTGSGEQLVWATNSSGTETPTWSATVPDDKLCDMAVSPDGLSVRVCPPCSNRHHSHAPRLPSTKILKCSGSRLVHAHLSLCWNVLVRIFYHPVWGALARIHVFFFLPQEPLALAGASNRCVSIRLWHDSTIVCCTTPWCYWAIDTQFGDSMSARWRRQQQRRLLGQLWYKKTFKCR